MSKIKQKAIVLLAISILVAICVSMCVVWSVRAQTESKDYTLNVDPYGQYTVNDMFLVHEGKFEIMGEMVPAEYNIISPSGRAYATDTMTLTEAGEYTVKYFTVYDGIYYSESVPFNVLKSTFTVVGNGSTEYTTYDFSGVTHIPTNIYVADYDFDHLTSIPITGQKVTLSQGAVLQYAGIIDFNGKTKDDRILKLHILPSVIGETDIQKITVRFTDITDENNYIELTLEDCNDPYLYGMVTGYAKAAPAGEIQTGVDTNKGWICKNRYGQGINCSFHGISYGTTPIGSEGMSWIISMDYEERIVYAGPNKAFVVDLDDPQYFTTLWNGFAQDKAYMTISFEQYSKSEGTIIITDLAGCDLSTPQYTDILKPILNIDFCEYDENSIPFGITDKKYDFFPVTVNDYDSESVESFIEVFYNYNSQNPITISHDGEGFIPELPGIYHVIYTAIDSAGNRSEVGYSINVYNEKAKVMSAAYSEQVIEQAQGEYVILKAPDNVQNCSGNYKIFYSVRTGGEEVFVSDDSSAKYVLMTATDYTVTATVTDRLGRTCSANYMIKVSVAGQPVFIGDYEKQIPHLFVTGYTYTLPVIQAYDYTLGKYVDATVNVSEGKGLLDGHIFTPETEGEVIITYKVGASELKFVRVIYSTQTAGGGLDMRKFFITSQGVQSTFVVGEGDSSLTYVGYEFPDGESEMEFFNLLSAEAFTFNLAFKNNSYKSVSLILTESASNRAIVIQFLNTGERHTVSLNGGVAYPIDNGALASLLITFGSDGSLKVGSLPFSINSWTDGTQYNGFESHKLLMSLKIDAYSGFMIETRSINGQVLSDRTSDSVRPVIQVYNMPSGLYSLGTTVALGDMVATDVISPVIRDESVTVILPDGTVLFDKAPVDNYEITLSQVGSYLIRYMASDATGRQQTYEISLLVVDEIRPTIELESASTTVEIGTEVRLAGYRVSDNDTPQEALNVSVFIRSPRFDMTLADASMKFTPTIKGEYTIVYYVTDQNGNSASAQYVVYVV